MEDLKKWFLDEVVPDASGKGCFSEKNESQSAVTCEFENFERSVHSFASVPFFLKIDLRNQKDPSEVSSCKVVVKFQNQDPIFRENMKTVPQFKNEVTFYKEVIVEFMKFLSNSNQSPDILFDIIPKCYFASFKKEEPEKSLIILQDLRTQGFKISPSKTELDFDHCSRAVESLARFHAISFAMKLGRWKSFESLKNSFECVWFTDDAITRQQCEEFRKRCAQRGIDYLKSQPNSEVPTDYLDNLKKILEPTFDLLANINSPKEPLSVICHGDFNRNNLLFKYENEKPSACKLIDFQTYQYASPCLDLSFLIYMNTTLDFRKKYFHAIFDIYYSTLIKSVSSILNIQETVVATELPLTLFKEDFERVSLHSYVTVSFFLPVMMCPSTEDFDEVMKSKTFTEMAEENCKQGGERLSKIISEVIIDFYRRNFYKKKP